jgi:hypothetical protein
VRICSNGGLGVGFEAPKREPERVQMRQESGLLKKGGPLRDVLSPEPAHATTLSSCNIHLRRRKQKICEPAGVDETQARRQRNIHVAQAAKHLCEGQVNLGRAPGVIEKAAGPLKPPCPDFGGRVRRSLNPSLDLERVLQTRPLDNRSEARHASRARTGMRLRAPGAGRQGRVLVPAIARTESGFDK